MKKLPVPLYFCLLFLQACQDRDPVTTTTIEGRIQNLPNETVYLTDAVHWRKPFDSAISKDGHFEFHIHADSSFIPFRAAIHFFDTSFPGHEGLLHFRNYLLADSASTSTDGFYVERGYTRMEGDLHSKIGVRVFAGTETDLKMKNQLNDFGWLDIKNADERAKKLESFKAEIMQHPNSVFLQEMIYKNKEQYSKEELIQLLDLFTPARRNSKWGDSLRTNIELRPGKNDPLPQLRVTDGQGKKFLVPGLAHPLTMMVFWASWCGPCRREIPELKQLFAEYKGKGLSIISISIDEWRDNWKAALSEEKMEWAQYIADPVYLSTTMQQYNFVTIPFSVIVDQQGLEVGRFDGYDDNSSAQYHQLIEKFLK